MGLWFDLRGLDERFLLNDGNACVHDELFFCHGEGLDVEYSFAEGWDGDTVIGVDGEDAFEKLVALRGYGEDPAQEIAIAKVLAEGLILRSGLLPGIAIAGKVDEYNTESPDVVGLGGVRNLLDINPALAF